MALQVTGKVHTQKGRILMDMVIAARISNAFILFGLILAQEKHLFFCLLTQVAGGPNATTAAGE